jgi:hypothetical protein
VDNEAYWTLDNTLNDTTGNGYTATNVGATYNISGKINGAYYFDGVDDRINFSITPNPAHISMSCGLMLLTHHLSVL